MTPTRLAVLALPGALMLVTLFWLSGIDGWTANLGPNPASQLLLRRVGTALPYVVATGLGAICLFAARGGTTIRWMGSGAAIGSGAIAIAAMAREWIRLANVITIERIDPATGMGALIALAGCAFGLRVAVRGNAAFASTLPRRVRGKRSIHGEAEWMSIPNARRLFPSTGGMVIGEAYQVGKDTGAARNFRASDPTTWGAGGRSPLLCFDASFGSTHGLAFAGSGGFKTTSVTVPTALKWGGGLVTLDPSSEVAPMVIEHRRRAGRDVFVLDPRDPATGFNVLDWIGQFGGTKEEDLVAVANWVVTDTGRQVSIRDDFFRASALQLITALIADVCLSGHTDRSRQTLRQMRENLAEPEPNYASGCKRSTTARGPISSRRMSRRSSP